jgi:hypothetical protein
MEWYQRVLESVIVHGPLVIGAGFVYWRATPALIKTSLQNGSGEVVRSIIRDENHKANIDQTGHFALTLKATIEQHEDFEKLKMESALAPVLDRLSRLEARISKKRAY